MPNFPSCSKEIREVGARIRKREDKNEMYFLPYLCGRTLFSSLGACFSLAFSSWILSFPSCQKGFISQSNHISMLTKSSPSPCCWHCRGRLYFCTWRALISLAPLARAHKSIKTPIHPRSSSVCFYFGCEEKLISSFTAGLLILSNGLLLPENKKLQSLFLNYYSV